MSDIFAGKSPVPPPMPDTVDEFLRLTAKPPKPPKPPKKPRCIQCGKKIKDGLYIATSAGPIHEDCRDAWDAHWRRATGQ